uniref:Probable glutamate--tRNA ligase, mitochondrial n=1 Tax=Panagrolaimus sp. JU765 TaxID=591449 RepID=A0AC34RT08_9BILA
MKISLKYLQNIRVRFAPSPTGKLHLGSLRTALFNYLFSKHYSGTFILRIEDTDQQRIIPECSKKFETNLKDFNLIPDESPFIGGNYGPYVQSERKEIYKNYSERLIDSGHAYHCFCSSERLEILRKNALKTGQIPRYDNRCRNLSKDEAKTRIKNGEQYVIRFKFDKQQIFFNDITYGDNLQTIDEGDFVIMKSDGYPTYHFANIVDDRLMEISHVIRGAEWLPSTPKHVKLYEAFEWIPPKFVHLPLITRDGKKKLSKRDADAFVEYYTIEKGYLPLAVLNFLLRNGSGLKNFEVGRLYSLEEMVGNFDEKLIGTRDFMMDKSSLDHYGKLAFRNSPKKLLLELTAKHVKENFPGIDEEFLKPEYIERVINFINENEESFSCLSELTAGDFKFFFGRPKTAENLLQKFSSEICQSVLEELLKMEKINIEAVKELAKKMKMKNPQIMGIIRCSLIDSFQGPPLSELFNFFSEDELRIRFKEMMKNLK